MKSIEVWGVQAFHEPRALLAVGMLDGAAVRWVDPHGGVFGEDDVVTLSAYLESRKPGDLVLGGLLYIKPKLAVRL